MIPEGTREASSVKREASNVNDTQRARSLAGHASHLASRIAHHESLWHQKRLRVIARPLDGGLPQALQLAALDDIQLKAMTQKALATEGLRAPHQARPLFLQPGAKRFTVEQGKARPCVADADLYRQAFLPYADGDGAGQSSARR